MNNKQIPPAEVTDEPSLASDIINEACWKFVKAMPHQLPGPIWNNLKPALYASLIYYHRATLALRPAAVPMTDEEIESLLVNWPKDGIAFFEFARAIEAHHGITAQAKTGEPIYQICKADSVSVHSAWIDVDKQAYDGAGLYSEYGRRMLYTHPAPGVPDGWRIEEKGGELIVRKNGFGGYSARKNTESIAEAVLHELALDLLAASPAQKG